MDLGMIPIWVRWAGQNEISSCHSEQSVISNSSIVSFWDFSFNFSDHEWPQQTETTESKTADKWKLLYQKFPSMLTLGKRSKYVNLSPLAISIVQDKTVSWLSYWNGFLTGVPNPCPYLNILHTETKVITLKQFQQQIDYGNFPEKKTTVIGYPIQLW